MRAFVYSLNRGEQVLYVGITTNIKQRSSSHRLKERRLDMKIIEEHSDITKSDLLIREEFWINEMGKRGHKLLNKKSNNMESVSQNQYCPKCGKLIFNYNFTFIGDIKQHIDCDNPKGNKVVAHFGNDVFYSLIKFCEKEERTVQKAVEWIVSDFLLRKNTEANKLCGIHIPPDIAEKVRSFAEEEGKTFQEMCDEMIRDELKKMDKSKSYRDKVLAEYRNN